jgi:hypothetical protein
MAGHYNPNNFNGPNLFDVGPLNLGSIGFSNYSTTAGGSNEPPFPSTSSGDGTCVPTFSGTDVLIYSQALLASTTMENRISPPGSLVTASSPTKMISSSPRRLLVLATRLVTASFLTKMTSLNPRRLLVQANAPPPFKLPRAALAVKPPQNQAAPPAPGRHSVGAPSAFSTACRSTYKKVSVATVSSIECSPNTLTSFPRSTSIPR